MKQYPKYIDSGVDWIGEIPEHWTIGRLKYYNDIIMGQSPNSEDYSVDPVSLPFLQGNAEFGELYPIPSIYCDSANKTSDENDILISVRAPVGAVNISDQVYGIGRGLAAVRKPENFKFNFFYLQMAKSYLDSLSTGSTFTAISVDDLKNLPYPKISSKEQTAIANFLDHKTRQIDYLIAKKERLIELLKEERTAVINQAVTKGLDPNVPMKDSGIEWLGEIPGHWEVKKIKHIGFLKSGNGIKSDQLEESGEFPVYGGNGMRGYFSEYTHDGEYILIGRQGALCGNINLASGKFWASEHAVVVELYDPYVLKWAMALFETMNLNQYSISAAQPGLSVEKVNNLKIPVPPLSEQNDIMIYVQEKDELLNKSISTYKLQIELLQEYKTSLINEAVTGKIMVTDGT